MSEPLKPWEADDDWDYAMPVDVPQFLFIAFLFGLVAFLALLAAGCSGLDLGLGRPPEPHPWLQDPPGESELEPRI